MRTLLLFCIPLFFISCTSKTTRPKPGDWRLTFALSPQKELPVEMKWSEEGVISMTNASEVIEWTDIEFKEDSITLSHPVFEGVFKGVYSEEKITGDYIKPSLDRVVPFTMSYGNSNRFETTTTAGKNVVGIWEAVFSPESEADRYLAKGIFEQNGDAVTGTFRTLTGDYRFLEGVVDGEAGLLDLLEFISFDQQSLLLGVESLVLEVDVHCSLRRCRRQAGGA